MKKIITIIFFMFIFTTYINATTIDVDLFKCVDGDTAWFTYQDKTLKARFLAIDTPESTTKKEKFGKEASLFTCNKLEKAKKISLEYDDASDKLDKYNRELVWVFVDNKLLQEEIVKEGLGKVYYIYGDYKYLDELYNAEKYAKKNKLNIWEDNNYFMEYYFIYVVLGVGTIIYLLFPKTRKDLEQLFKKKFKIKSKL